MSYPYACIKDNLVKVGTYTECGARSLRAHVCDTFLLEHNAGEYRLVWK